MRFDEIELRGGYVIELERFEDDRGFFARLCCERELEQQGIAVPMVQTSISVTRRRGTLRGLHFQIPPSREGKLIRCLRGRIHDVIVDLRPRSPTFKQHFALELDSTALRALYAPPGMAHGFQTLEDDCLVLYQMNDYYAPQLGRGVRWNDPQLGIRWPLPDPEMNERDRGYPDLSMELVSGFASMPI